ncbi:BatD family protein [Thaumasiovibrio subtropicus]|uniref:BatD family protein n=1 Tax=Thaumasiovibrio subtropicus TaxID=1891207 RepID=UPI000B34C7DA|nr:BatD family protein [Thaumasiovibrio subtropicus]
MTRLAYLFPVYILVASLLPMNTIAGANAQTTDITLTVELDDPRLYPDTEATYTLTVESPERVHFSSISLPTGKDVRARRIGQHHDYYFEGTDEYRISTYQYRVATDAMGTQPLASPTLTFVELNPDGSRERIQLNAEPIMIERLPIPDTYPGLWLPAEKVTLSQQWSSEANTIKAGETLERHVHLFIAGRQIDDFPALQVTYPDAITLLNETPKFTQTQAGTTLTLHQSLIVREDAEIVLDPIVIPWFNLTQHQTAIASVNGRTLNPSAAKQSATKVTEPQIWRFRENVAWMLIGTISGLCVLCGLALLVRCSRRRNATSPTHQLKLALVADQPLQVQLYWQQMPADTRQRCQAALSRYLQVRYQSERSDSEKEKSKQALLEQLNVTTDKPRLLPDFDPL